MFEIFKNLIVAAALAHGVNATDMVNIGWCESKFQPSVIGAGVYHGLFQLGPGLLQRFYNRGYDDWQDPAQQSNFVAEIIASGGRGNWPRSYAYCRAPL